MSQILKGEWNAALINRVMRLRLHVQHPVGFNSKSEYNYAEA